MAVPIQLPTFASNESYGGVVYHIEGELVPVLHIEVSQTPVYFEHHILLWKDPALDIGIKQLKGAFKRILSGMPVFMTETRGSAAREREKLKAWVKEQGALIRAGKKSPSLSDKPKELISSQWQIDAP